MLSEDSDSTYKMEKKADGSDVKKEMYMENQMGKSVIAGICRIFTVGKVLDRESAGPGSDSLL